MTFGSDVAVHTEWSTRFADSLSSAVAPRRGSTPVLPS